MSAVYSFGEIIEEILAEGRASGDTGVQRTRARQYVNQEYLDFCAEFDIPQLMHEIEVDLPTTAQSNARWPRLVVTAPMDVQKVTHAEVFNNDGNDRKYDEIEVVDHTEFERRTRGKDRSEATGKPSLMAVRRVEGAREDLQTSLAALIVKSNDSGDTTQKVMVSYYTGIAKRIIFKTEVTLNGMTDVSVNASVALVQYFSKDGDTTGQVILEHDGNEIGRIMPWDRSVWFQVWEFSTFPDIRYTGLIEYKRVPPIMTADSDIPFFTPPWAHDLFIAIGKARLLLFQEDADQLKHEAIRREIRNNFLIKHMPEKYQQMRFKIR